MGGKEKKVRRKLSEKEKSNRISRAHYYVNKHFVKPDRCEFCGIKKNDMEWSNKNHKYKKDVRSEWQYLCRSCHSRYDFGHGLRKGHSNQNLSTLRVILKYLIKN